MKSRIKKEWIGFAEAEYCIRQRSKSDNPPLVYMMSLPKGITSNILTRVKSRNEEDYIRGVTSVLGNELERKRWSQAVALRFCYAMNFKLKLPYFSLIGIPEFNKKTDDLEFRWRTTNTKNDLTEDEILRIIREKQGEK